MGDVGISVEEDGNLKVVQHYNLRFLLRRLRGDDLQRRPVVRWWNCSQNSQDDTFVLKCVFGFTLLFALGRILFEPFITLISVKNTSPFSGHPNLDRTVISPSYWMLWVVILFPATFTAGFAIHVLMMKVRTTAPPLRKEEIKSISGLIQHL